MEWEQEQGGSKPLLPGIEVFLSKTCTIPLTRCDFDQIKETVESQNTKPIVVEQSSDKTDPEDTGVQEGTCTEPKQTESQTSTRPKTVIDYRKFLEDYTDEPPSPPKKKKAVDLKRKPSKTRIAASKYSHSKKYSKPPCIPRPARKGNRSNPPTTTLVTDAEVTTPTPQTTSTVPATSQETREAIEALLLLSEPPNQAHFDEDDNANLMLIVGGKKARADPLPAVPPPPPPT